MIEVKDVKRLGKLKEDENLRFRQFLKINADEDELDKQFKELHNKYFKIYDCSKCRNCCRELGTVITEDELDAITKTGASIDIGTQNFTHHDIIYITCERSCVSWEGQIRNMMKIIKRILLSL